MFRGISAINLDNKGRMAIPARYRLELTQTAKNQLILTIDTEHRCLLLYPLPEWELIEQKLSSLPSFSPVARRIQRLLMGHATELEIDGNGRILLPPVLREYAKLDKAIVLLGQGKKFEIWSEQDWHKKRDSWLAKQLTQATLPEELKNLSL